MTHQKGFAHAFLIIGLMAALIGALGFVFWQNFIYKEPVQTKTEIVKTEKKDEEPVCTDFLSQNNVLKRFDFQTSKKINRSFVIYKVSETQGLPKADSYVTTENLCKTEAVKVPELSISDDNEYGFGLAIQQGTIKKITSSPAGGKKYLAISTHGPGDGSSIVIIDEDGRYIGDATNFDYINVAQKYGMIGFWTFEDWVDSTTFTATAGSGSGTNLRITVNAKDASVISGPTAY